MSGEVATARVCGWCGAGLPGDDPQQQYCNGSHRTRAKRKRNGRPNRSSGQTVEAQRVMRERSRQRDALARSCLDKTPYPTEMAAIKIIQRRGGIGGIYECGGHWHISRRPVNAPKDWRDAFAAAKTGTEENR